jgi:hypothetical protein
VSKNLKNGDVPSLSLVTEEGGTNQATDNRSTFTVNIGAIVK